MGIDSKWLKGGKAYTLNIQVTKCLNWYKATVVTYNNNTTRKSVPDASDSPPQ